MIKNLLIIDSSIPSVDTFVNGLNDDTLHVLYSIDDTFITLKERIEQLNVSSFQHIGFVFVDDHSPLKLFVSYNTFISYNDTEIIGNNSTLFIKEIVTQYSPETLDFLACNLLSDDTWKKYFEYLMSENEGLTVRASEDQTGNLNAGGNWVLESTYDDVTHLYFKDEIGEWNYLLDSQTNHSTIIGIDGQLYTCGDNSNGQLARPTSALLFQPFVDLDGNLINNITAIACGSGHTVIIRGTVGEAGQVWACGNNFSGQLGDGTINNTTFFVQSKDINNILINDATAIACGESHTVIIRGTVGQPGQVWACGLNSSGQLGNGSSGFTPNSLLSASKDINNAFITNATAIACGTSHTVVIRDTVGEAGQVWACGLNFSGQLGTQSSGIGTNRLLFVQSVDNTVNNPVITNATAIACGNAHTVIIRGTVGQPGQVWACGSSSRGQLGNQTSGSGTNSSLFVRSKDTTSAEITNATAIACGFSHTVIIRGTVGQPGQVWACGMNNTGQLGDGSTTDRLLFVQSKDTRTINAEITDAAAIACSGEYTAIIRHVLNISNELERQVWGCGLAQRLGIGESIGIKETFVQSKFSSDSNNFITDAIAIGCFNNSAHTVIIRGTVGQPGQIWGCGTTSSGRLGPLNNSELFIEVPDMTDVVMVSSGNAHTVILKKNGEVWACGLNANGQLGDGTTDTRTFFVQSKDISNAEITDATAIACGFSYTVIIRQDGAERQVWACGNNGSGQIGTGVTGNMLFFIQSKDNTVDNPVITDATAIACSNAHTVIIRGVVGQPGQVWASGSNGGRLGDGTNDARTFFVQSKDTSNTEITNATAIACGSGHTVIIRQIGAERQVWACGFNTNGRLGDGTTSNRILFVQSKDNTTNNPVITDATAIACGHAHTVLIRGTVGEAGQVWACGLNSSGRLGDGTITSRSFFVPSSSSDAEITDAIAITCGFSHTVIIRQIGAERQVWACGDNTNGRLGDGTNTNRSLFVQYIPFQLQNPKFTKSSILNPDGPSFINLEATNVSAYFPDMVSNSISITDTNDSTSFNLVMGLTNKKIFKLEPANTVFSDYISFDITDAFKPVYFKSETDSEPVLLGTNPNNDYGAYYEIPQKSTIRIYTKHFSEFTVGTDELDELESVIPHPILINLNVELEANGKLEIFGSQPETIDNRVDAAVKLPVSALYTPASGGVTEKGLIEFFEPLDALGDKAAVYSEYKETFASLLANGLQAVLEGEMDAKAAAPFNALNAEGNGPLYGADDLTNKYKNHTGFGRLALGAYAHHIFGHQASTAGITNDQVFMNAILSHNADGDWKGLDGVVLTGDIPIESSAEDAKLAVRLVRAIVTKKESDMTKDVESRNTVSEVGTTTKKDILANIVKQVIGQDISRAMDQDNNELDPGARQPLRFIAGDTIVVNIKLTKPDVVVGVGQGQTQLKGILEDKVSADEETSYSIVIQLI